MEPLTQAECEYLESHLHLVTQAAKKLRRRLLRKRDPDDLRHDGILGLIAAMRHSDPSEPEASFPYYARKWIVGAMLDARRKMRIETELVTGEEFMEESIPMFTPPQYVPHPDACSAETRLNDKIDIWRAMQMLTTRQRLALVLHYYGGLSNYEIAERLHLGQAHSATGLIFRARENLREKLKGMAK